MAMDLALYANWICRAGVRSHRGVVGALDFAGRGSAPISLGTYLTCKTE